MSDRAQDPPGGPADQRVAPQPQQPPSQRPQVQQPNGLAVTALVLGIVGALFGFMPLMFWLAITLGILALIFGVVGFGRSNEPARGGRGQAIAGIVLGIVGITVGFMQVFVLDQILESFNEEPPGVEDATP